MCHNAKVRAKRHNIPYDLDWRQIKIPKLCPILGIPLKRGKGKAHDNSPSLDRVKPKLGYVEGNIVVMSHRANTLKSNGSAEEHEAVAKWLRTR